MLYTPLSGLPYPAGSEAPDLAAYFMQLTEALDPVIPTVVADEGDRDARLINAPVGKPAVTADGSYWVKTSPPGTATWATIRQVKTYTGFAWNSGLFSDNGNSKITYDGEGYHLFIGATYNGADVVTDSHGFLANMLVATISDPAWRPIDGETVTFPFLDEPNVAGWGNIYGSTGSVNLAHANATTTITNDSTVIFSADWKRP